MNGAPYSIHGESRASRWLVTCDHASNRVPPCIGGGSLGIAPEDMARHIAYDVGAAGLARALADALQAPAILSAFSRLVIDPNRGEDDPTLVMRLYDGTLIPANRHADAAEIARRLDAFHRPYHAACAALAARRPDTVICAVHTMTRQLRGRPPRPWQVSILSADDRRLTDPLIASLRGDPALATDVAAETGEPFEVGDNQPYLGHLEGDAVDRHALRHGRLNALIELRNDLVATEEQQARWAARLAPHLAAALDAAQSTGDRHG